MREADMKRFVLFLLVAVSVGGAAVFAHDDPHPSAFIGVSIGALGSNVPGFDSFYPTRVAFCFVATVGVPVSRGLTVVLEMEEFSKSRVPVSGPSYYDVMSRASPQVATANADLEQLKVELGAMKAFSKFEGIGLAIEAGLTYSTFLTSLPNPAPGTNGPPSPVPKHRALGAFVGFVGEYPLADSRWAIVVDPQYNQSWTIGTPKFASYGDMRISCGIRLYLEQR